MAASSITLSFGMEIEAIFSFNEDILKEYLRRSSPLNTVYILKDIAVNEQSFRHKAYPRRPYRSWALLAHADDSTTHNLHTKAPFVTINDTTASSCTPGSAYRAYRDEPIKIVSELLSTLPGLTNLPTHALHASKQTTYNTWSISNDFSLSGVAKDIMQRHLSDRIIQADAWDSWGVELISPPYTSISAATADTSTLLTKLGGDKTANYGSFVTEACGFHVHVGQPENRPFELSTLRHLAWLLVIFEDAINGMHATHRRQIYTNSEDGTACEILSNRDHWMLEEPTGPVLRTVMDEETGELISEEYDQHYKNLGTIQMDIFGEGQGMDVGQADRLEKLVKLMNPQKRGHVVNFTGLISPGRPQTVEFRQHAGTLDVEEMGHWVQFCVGLVALAHKCACEGEVRWSGKRWEEVVDMGIEELWEEMGFQEESRNYYRGRGVGGMPTAVFEKRFEEEEEDENVEEEEEEEEDNVEEEGEDENEL